MTQNELLNMDEPCCGFSTYVHVQVGNRASIITRYGQDKVDKDALRYCPSCKKDIGAYRIDFNLKAKGDAHEMYCLECLLKQVEERFIDEMQNCKLEKYSEM